VNSVIAKVEGRGKRTKVTCPFDDQPCIFFQRYNGIPYAVVCVFCPKGLDYIRKKLKKKSSEEAMFYCSWRKKWTTLEKCKSCYDNIRGECNPNIEKTW
jgi:hypothetical protein